MQITILLLLLCHSRKIVIEIYKIILFWSLYNRTIVLELLCKYTAYIRV